MLPERAQYAAAVAAVPAIVSTSLAALYSTLVADGVNALTGDGIAPSRAAAAAAADYSTSAHLHLAHPSSRLVWLLVLIVVVAPPIVGGALVAALEARTYGAAVPARVRNAKQFGVFAAAVLGGGIGVFAAATASPSTLALSTALAAYGLFAPLTAVVYAFSVLSFPALPRRLRTDLALDGAPTHYVVVAARD